MFKIRAPFPAGKGALNFQVLSVLPLTSGMVVTEIIGASSFGFVIAKPGAHFIAAALHPVSVMRVAVPGVMVMVPAGLGGFSAVARAIRVRHRLRPDALRSVGLMGRIVPGSFGVAFTPMVTSVLRRFVVRGKGQLVQVRRKVLTETARCCVIAAFISIRLHLWPAALEIVLGKAAAAFGLTRAVVMPEHVVPVVYVSGSPVTFAAAVTIKRAGVKLISVSHKCWVS